MGYCRCCGLNNAIFTPRKEFNDLPQAAIVCDLCARHQGSNAHDLGKAVNLHREMAAEHERERVEALEYRYAAALAQRDAVIAEKEVEIASLRKELAERPVQVVEKWVDGDELRAAHEGATAAFHSRDHAFRQMCLIHIKHHEMSGERCSCGRSIADCDVVAILEGYRALMRWERRQEERRDNGQSHELPWEYVKYLGGREPSDDPHEFDSYPYATGS